MFRSVLIANRGEIACRIIRTLRRMGIRAVAVHSEADADAMHVATADEAILVGPAAAADSYLRIDRIVDAAKRTGVEAVHPGYGFLSENAASARACADAGLVFIGPRPEVIELMGEKDRAKRAMQEAGIPVVPGRAIEEADDGALRGAAADLGYPVLIKATAGGGGRGMRVVRSDADFQAALEGARREARAAFADDRVILERFLEDPRHIEVQVFGDAHGNVCHLFERDCSVQRRHQKVIEEAPAPGLSESVRAALCATAVRAAAAIGYTGAGTVEFLLAPDESFYFMEMNTRLQVEHPVTEMITGLDLVEWQLRVAAGEPLPLGQGDIWFAGHAVEVRLCAEDPEQGFVPATGRLEHLALPAEERGLRLDTGVRAGDRISPHYDSLFAKLVVHGSDRPSTLGRLQAVLDKSAVMGVATNIDLLARIVGHPDFLAGGVGTRWLEEHLGDVAEELLVDDEAVATAALWLLAEERRARAAVAERSAEPDSPWHRTDGWRLNDRAHQTIRLRAGGGEVEVLALAAGDGYELQIGERCLAGRLVGGTPGPDRVTIDGRTAFLQALRQGASLTLRWRGGTFRFTVVDPLAEAEPLNEPGGLLTAPMPGRIVRVPVAAGAEVESGTPLLVLEAMKMEHTLRASAAGEVTALHVVEGDQVEEGTVLLDFAPRDPA